MIAYHSEGIRLLPVSPETGRATGLARKLAEDQANWSRGVIVWSADSEWVLFTYNDADDWRRVEKCISVRGGALAEAKLSRPPDHIVEVAYALNRQRLAFTGRDENGKYALYVTPPAEGDPVVKLKLAFGEEPYPSRMVSPDGNRLLFQVSRGRRGGKQLFDFFVIPISLDRAENVGPAMLIFKDWQHPWGGKGGIAWSPDSTRLAVPAKDADWDSSSERKGALWVVPVDGSPARRLTRTPEEPEESSPTWSPDSRMIAYRSQSADGLSLYAIRADGGPPKRVWTQSGKGRLAYAWFPDSREIGLVSDGGLVAVNAVDSSVRPFLKLAEAGFDWLYWFQWSPDGHTLALYGGGEDGELALLRASDRKIERLPADPPWKSALGWTADSQAIFCLAEQPDKVRPAGVVYELDLLAAWTEAKNHLTGEPSAVGSSPAAESEALPLVNGRFRDEFEGGNAKYWRFQEPEEAGTSRTHEVQHGELVLENTCASIGSSAWTNYVVSVRLRLESHSQHSLTGLGFRQGTAGSYLLSVEPTEKDIWCGVGYYDSAKRSRIGALLTCPYDFGLNQWYTIQVEVSETHFKVFVDGSVVAEANDGSHAQGGVGLLASNARVHFDGFSVQLRP